MVFSFPGNKSNESWRSFGKRLIDGFVSFGKRAMHFMRGKPVRQLVKGLSDISPSIASGYNAFSGLGDGILNTAKFAANQYRGKDMQHQYTHTRPIYIPSIASSASSSSDTIQRVKREPRSRHSIPEDRLVSADLHNYVGPRHMLSYR